jgi:hypothetical protein
MSLTYLDLSLVALKGPDTNPNHRATIVGESRGAWSGNSLLDWFMEKADMLLSYQILQENKDNYIFFFHNLV